MSGLAELVTFGSLGLSLWHHVGFPGLLRAASRAASVAEPLTDDQLPTVTLIMPAYNEADVILEKLLNVAALDYPRERLHVIVACDGCTDATPGIAQTALRGSACAGLQAEVIEHAQNRGKVAVLNDTIAGARGDIIVLSDVSAMLPADALRRLVAHFKAPEVGAVGGGYALKNPSAGEARYWPYQIRVKQGEAALGAPLGLHGAFYGLRRAAWTPIPADTINDDFVLPLQVLRQGWKIKYDSTIVALEVEQTDPRAELRRRRRIAAGNMQQLIRMPWLLSPVHPGVALAFASGKALRVLAPLLLALGLAGSVVLASHSVVFLMLLMTQVGALLAALAGGLLPGAPRICSAAWYIVSGHAASLVGSARYLLGMDRRPWRRAHREPSDGYLPLSVVAAKRGLDLLIALLALICSLPIWPIVAVAIKLDSPGPVLYRQLRIGRALHDRTELFMMIKFRSMRTDAEARGGAVWATKRDPRITRVGALLRKTRLDEIPQLINVIRGDMAIVGPRPERPGFYARLDRAIPFFAERTVGLRPGITGFAQVNQGYDRDLEDVRRKVMFDHAYALRLLNIRSWLLSDAEIVVRTFAVMVMGRGQ